MWTRSIVESERPYRARGRMSRPRNRRPYKRKARNRCSARRESEGVVVPEMAVHENAVGGKGPCFVRAFAAGKRGECR